MEWLIDLLKRTGTKVRDNKTYQIYDLQNGELVLSMTILHEGKETNGHLHEVEEVYTFVVGQGNLQIDTAKCSVKPYDTIPIPSNNFHKVYNTGRGDCIFVSLFKEYEGYGERGKS